MKLFHYKNINTKFNIAFQILLLAAILLAGGCATSNMKSWMGSTESQLVSSWGPPQQVYTQGGNRILTWENRWGEHGEITCRKSFTINSYGTIVNWRWKGCLF